MLDSQEDDMPVTNEILPFAPQATVALSEILSLAEYTADSAYAGINPESPGSSSSTRYSSRRNI